MVSKLEKSSTNRILLVEKYERPNEIDSGGNFFWKNKYGLIHRGNDMPAVICADGTKFWYRNGIHHRDGDLPAVVFLCGEMIWYKNGQYHRDGNMPAIIDSYGNKYWYKNGKEYFPEQKF